MPRTNIKWEPVLLVSLIGALIALWLYVDPSAKRTAIRAFGEKPLGLPVILVCGLAAAILFIPAIWTIPALTRIAHKAREDGKGGSFWLVHYVLTVGKQYPELRKTQIVLLAGIAYFLIVLTVGTTYAAIRGL